VSACGCTTIQACPLHVQPRFTNTASALPVRPPSACTQCGGSGVVSTTHDKRVVRVACACVARTLATILATLPAVTPVKDLG